MTLLLNTLKLSSPAVRRSRSNSFLLPLFPVILSLTRRPGAVNWSVRYSQLKLNAAVAAPSGSAARPPARSPSPDLGSGRGAAAAAAADVKQPADGAGAGKVRR